MDLPPPPDISNSLRFFRREGLYCDVRLRLSSESSFNVSAHRVVLAASSPFFSAHLEKKDDVQDMFLPPELRPDVMTLLLSWMYNEPSKIEGGPENVDFLEALHRGVELLGLNELNEYLAEIRDRFPTKNIKAEIGSDDFDRVKLDAKTEPNIGDDDNYAGDSLDDTEETRVKVEPNLVDQAKNRSVERKKKSRQCFTRKSRKKNSRKRSTKLSPKLSCSTIPCDKCGSQIARTQWTSHSKFCHSKLSKEEEEKQAKRPVNDPILKDYLVGHRFTCPSCQFVLVRDEVRSSLFYQKCAQHMYKVHKVICPNICFPCPREDCKTALWSQRGIELHIAKKHERDPKVKPRTTCNICGASLWLASLKQHMSVKHSPAKEISCNKCDKIFSNELYFKIHEKKAHPNGSCFEYKCTNCRGFSTFSRETFLNHCYRKHQILHDGANLHKCPTCDYKSPVLFLVQRHKKRSHPLDKAKCPECDKVFFGEVRMKDHHARVHLNAQTTPCPKCHVTFRTKGGLRYHLWKTHRVGRWGVKDDDFRFDRPYKCIHCPHTTGFSGNLLKHCRNKHPGLPQKYVDLRMIGKGYSNGESTAIQESR